MKVSIYIEENIKQVNFKPENKYEADILNSIVKNEVSVEFHNGTFSECQGGHIRYYSHEPNNEEVIMVVREKKKVKP